MVIVYGKNFFELYEYLSYFNVIDFINMIGLTFGVLTYTFNLK